MNWTAQVEHKDTVVTIRLNGEYVAIRDDFKSARNTINFSEWNSVEQFRIRNAQGR